MASSSVGDDAPRSPWLVADVGIEAGGEELGEQRGDVRVPAQRLLDVVLAERRARLAQVPAQRPERPRPRGAVEAREQHEPVEPVGLGVAAPDARERLLEPLVVALGRRTHSGGYAGRSRRSSGSGPPRG